MKVCIYGAGAIGGHIGGHLARGGADVSLIARGPHLDALQRNGIRVVSVDDDFTMPVFATDDPAELGPQDYVFITLKSHQVDGVLDFERRVGKEMPEAAAQIGRAAHLPEQPVQAFGTFGMIGGKERAKLFGQIKQDRA